MWRQWARWRYVAWKKAVRMNRLLSLLLISGCLTVATEESQMTHAEETDAQESPLDDDRPMTREEWLAMTQALFDQALRDAQPPPPLCVEDGVDAPYVALLKDGNDEAYPELFQCTTDAAGRIISVYLWGDSKSPSLDSLLNRIAPIKHVRSAKIEECHDPLSDDGLQHLAGWTQLEELEIRAAALSGRAFERLTRTNPLPQLRRLLVDLGPEAEADYVLAAVANCTELRSIKLNQTDVTDAGLVHLAKLTKLEELNFNGTKITGEGMRHLRPLVNLKELNIERVDIDDAGLSHLSGLHQLSTLYIADAARITDAGLAHLGRMGRLETLSLNGTCISPAGLESLTSLPRLKVLNLDNTPLDDRCVPLLCRMKQLKQIDLWHTRFTSAGVDRLAQLLPECVIYTDLE
jgi:hypothetical protein